MIIINNRRVKQIFSQPLAILLIISFALWSLGLPGWLVKKATAANLTWLSDTLSDSDLGVAANHTIAFRLQQAITASSTIVLTFDAHFQSTSSPAFANTDATDYDIASSTTELTMYAAGGCTGSGATASFEITSVSATNVFTFTHCNGSADVASNATTTIEIGNNATTGGTGNSRLVNPLGALSYTVSVAAPAADTGVTRVAIIDDVTVTASVDTSLTFTISAVASGQTNANGIGGTTSVGGADATVIQWGTLSVSPASSTASQTLAVTTNATHGFMVTLKQDGNLISSTGADIDMFDDGVDGAPAAWSSPAGTLDSENTYGHMGVTSEDSTLSTGDTFGTALFDAASTTPLEVFYHSGPSDGSTDDKGHTHIGFKIQINALQEAGTDYTQSLTYICTPIF